VKDSFGVEIDEGDYILSASTSRGWAKIGTVYTADSGRLMLEIEHGAYPRHRRRSEIGSMVLVLRKADGTVPEHVGVAAPVVLDPKILDSALRDYVADLDYDIHKSIESGEEDGEDHYAEEVESFIRAYEHAASKTGESQ
jgi:hypothetical protein